jgi:hypothetical protein
LNPNDYQLVLAKAATEGAWLFVASVNDIGISSFFHLDGSGSHECQIREGNGTVLGDAAASGTAEEGVQDSNALVITGGTVVPTGTGFKDIQVWCRGKFDAVSYAGVSLLMIQIGEFF